MLRCLKFFGSSEIPKSIAFEKHKIIINAAWLVADATDPYQASLPMMIHAELECQNLCQASIKRMTKFLEELDSSENPSWNWMKNNSFKAWMWGRVLLAARAVNDKYAEVALSKLKNLLSEPLTPNDKPEFIAWAWAYLAAYSEEEYQSAKKNMLNATKQLAQQFQDSGLDHSALANEYWGWVMAIQAAARANDKDLYEKIKKYLQIGPAGKLTAIGEVLTRQLGKGSTNYLAWALAKVRLAAAMMDDQVLFSALEQPVESAILQAKKSHARAEYSLAMLDNMQANYWADSWENYYAVSESKETPILQVVRN